MKMPAVGRNDPCPCDSGKKFKKCRLGKGESATSGYEAVAVSDELCQAPGDRQFGSLEEVQAFIDHLTCDKYKAFRKLCTAAEWKSYEGKILERLKSARDTEQLRIRMHRKEYDEVAAVLCKGRYPLTAWDSDYQIQTAKRLEKRYPEEILKYYLTGLGNLRTNALRKEYARKAKVMAKVRRLLVEVLRDKNRWHAFATKVKQDNIKRPAFQEEFAKAVPGWRELK
jgi:chemotaxis methyl-accepting protein methylase